MQHSNKRKILVTLLIYSGLLTACNQAGNSAASTNSPQHAVVNNAAETQKFLRVVNHIGSTIDHINIISESGQVVFKSTTGLNCTNNQNCNVDINSLVTAKNMLAKFYNNKNQMISMAMLQNNSQKLMYSTVYTNNTIFGAQLFKKLVNVSKTNNQILLQQLTKFFKNNDQQVNVLTELGAYYSQQLAKGVIHNENDFYKILLSNLSAGKTIVGKSFLLAAPQKLQTGLLGCDNELGNKIFETVTPFAKLIPALGEAFEGLTTEGQAIFNWACAADTVDFAAEFDQINEKLDTIQASLDALTDNVQELRDMVNNQALGAEQVALNNLYNQEDVFNNVYVNYMAQINAKQSDSDRFKSVHQYVNSRGGLDKISQTSKPLFAEADGIIGGLSNQYETMQKLNNQLPYLTTLLNAQCSDVNKIPGDIIAKRNYCNAITMQVGMKIAAYAHMSRLRMSDAIYTVDTSAYPEDYLNPFGNGKGITWAESLKKVKQDFKIEMESVNTFYKKTLIMPTAGLPVQLVTTLNAKGNPLHCEESTPSGVNGIMEWYGNSNLGDKNQYIITKCIQDEAISRSITSRYYYVSDKNNVSNVLGTLVGQGFVKPVAHVTNNYKTYDSNNDIISGKEGIGVVDLTGYKISAKPYIINGKEAANGYFPENDTFEYSNNKAIAVRQDLWTTNTNNSINWIKWNGSNEPDTRKAGSRSYYLLRPSGDRTRLHYNLWVPYAWSSSGEFYTRTTNPIALELKLSNGERQWITFGFSHGYGLYSNYYEYAGIQCLTSHNCEAWHDGENDTSVIKMKLQNGQYIDIWFKWNNQDPYIYKNIYSQ